MIEKHIEGLNLTVKQAEPVSIKQPAGRISTLVIALCALAFVLCALLSVAPLSRILDPVIQLQTPFGTQLARVGAWLPTRSEEHTSELQSHSDLVCRLLLEKKK